MAKTKASIFIICCFLRILINYCLLSTNLRLLPWPRVPLRKSSMYSIFPTMRWIRSLRRQQRRKHTLRSKWTWENDAFEFIWISLNPIVFVSYSGWIRIGSTLAHSSTKLLFPQNRPLPRLENGRIRFFGQFNQFNYADTSTDYHFVSHELPCSWTERAPRSAKDN